MADEPIDSAVLRELLARRTPGPWWPSRHQGPADVDRGKVWAFYPGPLPVRHVVLMASNRQMEGLPHEVNMALAAHAPELAAEVLRLRGLLGEARDQMRGDDRALHAWEREKRNDVLRRVRMALGEGP